MAKKPIILFLAILAFSLVVSGCLKKPATNQNNNQPQGNVGAYPRGEGPFAEQTKKEANINASVEGKVIDAEIPGWKTYVNEGYGFKISYPAEWQYRQLNLGSSYKTNCVGFNRFPKTTAEMNKYKEVIVNFDICKVYNVELIEYLEHLGYQIDPEKDRGKTLQFIGGVRDNWVELEMEKIIFKGYIAIKFLPDNPRGTYSLYIQKDNNIYSIEYSAYPDQYSKEDLEAVVNTIEFLP